MVKIKTLKDLKDTICNVPDGVLESLGFGFFPGDSSDPEVTVCIFGSDLIEDPEGGYYEIKEKHYPKIDELIEDLNNWMNKIHELQSKIENADEKQLEIIEEEQTEPLG